MRGHRPVRSFFTDIEFSIDGNDELRDPQREGYLRTYEFFRAGKNKAILQIPVGCGKTGLASLLEETATYIGVGKTVLYGMARDGTIPARKVGKKWSFERAGLDVTAPDLPMVRSLRYRSAFPKAAFSSLLRI